MIEEKMLEMQVEKYELVYQVTIWLTTRWVLVLSFWFQ